MTFWATSRLLGQPGVLGQSPFKAILAIAVLSGGIFAVSKFTCAPPTGTTVTVANETDKATVVNIAFGSDSVVVPTSWTFCNPPGWANSCSFPLLPKASQVLPLEGSYLNATLAFDSVVGCGTTKAELNVNNPKWYDILDVSLVDGYSNQIAIRVDTTKLGPPMGKTGNEKIVGVFPYGCDICVERQNPPCGISKGTDGCKTGTQYKPDVVCQFQGTKMGGGSVVKVSLVEEVPAAVSK